MYSEGKHEPILITSDPALFEKEKQKAADGKIQPNTETSRTITKAVFDNPQDKWEEAQNKLWDNSENIAEWKYKDTWPKRPTNYNVVNMGIVMRVLRELREKQTPTL